MKSLKQEKVQSHKKQEWNINKRRDGENICKGCRWEQTQIQLNCKNGDRKMTTNI